MALDVDEFCDVVGGSVMGQTSPMLLDTASKIGRYADI